MEQGRINIDWSIEIASKSKLVVDKNYYPEALGQ